MNLKQVMGTLCAHNNTEHNGDTNMYNEPVSFKQIILSKIYNRWIHSHKQFVNPVNPVYNHAAL